MTDGVAFDIDGGLLLALVRALSVASLLSLFGGLTFLAIVAPRAFPGMTVERRTIEARLRRIVLASIAADVVATLAWLILQAADLADATTLAGALAAVPLVLSQTEFGHLIILQMAVTLAILPIFGWRGNATRTWLALGLAAVGVALQTGHSHAAAMEGGHRLLLAADVLHLLSGGAWLGGLLPLLVVVQAAPPRAGAIAARWFSPMGQVCVVGMVVSASYQGWVLVETLHGLVATAYGWMVMIKIGLFVGLFGLAAVNRYRFAPALAHGGSKRVLVGSIAIQTGCGLAVVAAAGILSGLAPPMKM